VVIVNADQFAMHQMVINVLEAARVAGYDKLTFAAQTGGKQ
jgi:biopolymer transport protein ExbD